MEEIERWKLIEWEYLLFRHYIVICAKAVNQDKLSKWSGLVESKIRILINQLDSSDGIELAHIYPHSYVPPPPPPSNPPHSETPEKILMWFVGLEFSKNDGAVVNLTLTSEIQMFTNAGTLLNALIMWIIYNILIP